MEKEKYEMILLICGTYKEKKKEYTVPYDDKPLALDYQTHITKHCEKWKNIEVV